VFPAAPAAPAVNPNCNQDILVTPLAPVSGFTIQYSFDDGASWGANTPPTADNCDGYKIKARYVTTLNGDIAAGLAIDCATSAATLRTLDKTAPTADELSELDVQCLDGV